MFNPAFLLTCLSFPTRRSSDLSVTVLVLRAVIYQLILIVTVIPYSFACLVWAPLPLNWRYRLTSGWPRLAVWCARWRSEEHTSELQSRGHLVCRLLHEKNK